MAKVHPNAASPADPLRTAKLPISNDHATNNAMTVWRKSLLLSCSGFTVFDASGNLAFRVDNYSSGSRREVVLMDAAGKPLLTIRRKKVSLAENWLLYNEEDAAGAVFSVRRCVDLPCSSKGLARVAPCGGGVGGGYVIDGSFSRRCCEVYDEQRRVVAEIRRKEAAGGVAFGGEVFRLVVHPEMDGRLAMAIVIVLDKMFGSRAA